VREATDAQGDDGHAIGKPIEHMNSGAWLFALTASSRAMTTRPRCWPSLSPCHTQDCQIPYSSLATGNLQKMFETMNSSKQLLINMEVQADFMDGAMAGSTLMSMQDHGQLPQAAGHG
jgi:hypothetical protein